MNDTTAQTTKALERPLNPPFAAPEPHLEDGSLLVLPGVDAQIDAALAAARAKPDMSALLGGLLSASVEQDLMLRKLVQLSEASASVNTVDSATIGSHSNPVPVRVNDKKLCRHGCSNGTTPLICQVEVARLIGCHYDTMSRDRKILEADGLVGKKLAGSGKRWRREDVMDYAERKGLTGKRKPGRPRKIF